MLPDGSAGDEVLAGQVYNNDSLAHHEQRMAELNGYFKGHSEEMSRTGVNRKFLWQEYPQLLTASCSEKQIIFPSRQTRSGSIKKINILQTGTAHLLK